MADNLGSVEIDVGADLTGFRRSLEVQANKSIRQANKGLPSINVDVDVKNAKLRAELKKIESDIAAVNKSKLAGAAKENRLAVLRASAAQKELAISNNIAKAKDDIAKAQAKADKDHEASIKRLGKILDEDVKKQREGIRIPLQAEVDRKRLTADLAGMKAAVAKLGGLKIKTEIDQKSALASLAALETRLAAAKMAASLKIGVDRESALGEIASLEAEIEAVRPTIHVNVDVEKGVFSRLAAAFRKSGSDSGSSFTKGFGSFKSQIFSDPQAALLKLGAAFVGLLGTMGPIGPTLSGIAAGAVAATGVMLSLGAAVGVGVLGFSGFGTAVSKGGDALKKLTPEARAAAEAVRGLNSPWKELQRSVQSGIFKGLAGDISKLSGTITSGLKPGFDSMAKSINTVIAGFLKWATSAKGIDQINTFVTGLAGAFGNLAPAISGLGEGLFNIFLAGMPAIQNMAKSLGDLGKRFGEWASSVEGQKSIAGFFGTISDAVQTFRNLGSVLGPVASGFGHLLDTIAPALNNLRGALLPVLQVLGKSLGSALRSLGPALAVVIQGISSLVKAAGPSLTKIFSIVAKTIGTLAPVISAVVTALQPLIAGLIGKVGPILVQVFSAASKAVAQIGTAITGTLLPAIEPLIPVLIRVGGFLAKVFGGAVIGVIQGFVGVVTGAINIISGVINVFVGILTGNWSKAWNGLKQILSGALTAILGALKVWWNLGIIGAFKKGALAVLGSFKKLWTGITGAAKSAVTSIGGMISRFWGGLKSAFTGGLKAVGRAVSSGFAVIKSGFSRPLVAIGNLVTSAMNAVRSVFSRGLSAVGTRVSTGINTVVGHFKSLGGKILGPLRGIIGKVKGIGSDIIDGLVKGLGVGKIIAKAKEIANALPAWVRKVLGIKSPSKIFIGIGRDIMRGWQKGLDKGAGPLLSEVNRFTNLLIKTGRRKAAQNFIAEFVKPLRNQDKLLAKVNAQLAAARERLDALKDARKEFKEGIVGSLTDNVFTSVEAATDAAGNTLALTAQNVLDSLKAQRDQAQQFSQVLKTLKGLGLSDKLLEDVATGGPAALAAAQALASGGKSAVDQANALANQTKGFANTAAEFAAKALRDSGIAAAQAFVDGLVKRKKDIQQTIRDMAVAMLLEIKAMIKKITGTTLTAGPRRGSRLPAPVTLIRGAGTVSTTSRTTQTNTVDASAVVNQNFYGPTTSGGRLREIDWTLRYATKARAETTAGVAS